MDGEAATRAGCYNPLSLVLWVTGGGASSQDPEKPLCDLRKVNVRAHWGIHVAAVVTHTGTILAEGSLVTT